MRPQEIFSVVTSTSDSISAGYSSWVFANFVHPKPGYFYPHSLRVFILPYFVEGFRRERREIPSFAPGAPEECLHKPVFPLAADHVHEFTMQHGRSEEHTSDLQSLMRIS